MQCPLFLSVSDRLNPLESPRHLCLTLSKSSDVRIQVELPRMRLSFFINKDMQLESSNFPGQVIDEDQVTGTFFGLRNQLVLCTKDPVVRLLPLARSVLIPHGEVEFENDKYHVAVTIKLNSNKRVMVHRYLIDTDLGHLISDGGLTSRLYKIYLHAVTSYCLPDPLTGRTGTEEALCALAQAATLSFEQIDQEQGRLLRLIGSLTPDRRYFYVGFQCTQTIKWMCIPPLSQHFGFSTATSAILDRADTLRIFYPLNFEVSALFVSRELVLLQRAALRTHSYYPAGTPDFMTEAFWESNLEDKVYVGRDALDAGWVKAGQTAAWTAHFTSTHWGRTLYKRFNLVSLTESWGNLRGSHNYLTLTYSPHWLELNLPECWVTLYNLCRHSSRDSNKFSLSICLATAAFGHTIPSNLVPVLVAFATNHKFASLDPPSHSHFFLEDGYKPNRAGIRKILSACSRDLESTPAAHLPQRDHESDSEVDKRRTSHFERQIKICGDRLAQILANQWSSVDIQPLFEEYSSWFMLDQCMPLVQDLFSSCRENMRLRDHLREVEQVLSSRLWSQGISFTRAPGAAPSISHPVIASSQQRSWNNIRIEHLMSRKACPGSRDGAPHEEVVISRCAGPPIETSRLLDLFSEFQSSHHLLIHRYGVELNKNRNDLANITYPLVENLPPSEVLDQSRESRHSALSAKLHLLKHALGPETPVEDIIDVCGVWPRITPRTLLQQLALKGNLRSDNFPSWKKEITGYAYLFLAYQRSQRLVSLARSHNVEEFCKEIDGAGAEFGTDKFSPDWLLAQVSCNNTGVLQ